MKIKFNDIGKALLLPIAIFPLAAILNGVGYTLEQLNIDSLHFVITIFKLLGGILLDYIPMIFSISVAYELSYDKSGFCAFNGLFAFIIITTLLSPEYISSYNNIAIAEISQSYGHINNQFVGIMSGLIAVTCHNKLIQTHQSLLKKHLKIILYTSLAIICITFFLYYLWPYIYIELVSFGTFISDKGPIGAGLYAFFNRLLIPFGMHHTLNSVFWFDLIGINDIGNFWSSQGVYGITGMYQAGFFPIMMFGLPAAALAMYKTASSKNKKNVSAFLISAAIASLFTGLTEPLEFSFMFIAPGLYLLHAVLTGLCVFIASLMQWIAGFSFSAGLVDFLLSINMPMSKDPWMLIILGIIMFFIYYFSFTYCIKKFDLPTIGKENDISLLYILGNDEIDKIAQIIIESVGGKHNIKSVDCCITRLRIQLYNPIYFNQKKIRESGATEFRQFNNEYQIIYGPQVDLILTKLEEKMSESE